MLGENEATHNFHGDDDEMEAWKPKEIKLRDPSAFDVTDYDNINIHGLASMIGGSMSLALADGDGYDELKSYLQDKVADYLHQNAEMLVKKFLAEKFPNTENDMTVRL